MNVICQKARLCERTLCTHKKVHDTDDDDFLHDDDNENCIVCPCPDIKSKLHIDVYCIPVTLV